MIRESMNMSQNIKTPEEILNDLEKLSPLDMPNYLLQCEFYDKTDAIQALEKAEEHAHADA